MVRLRPQLSLGDVPDAESLTYKGAPRGGTDGRDLRLSARRLIPGSPDGDGAYASAYLNGAAPREATELGIQRRAFLLDPGHEVVADYHPDIELAGQPLQAARDIHRVADDRVIQPLSITDAS